MNDRILHFTLLDGAVRGLMIRSTDTVAEAARIHGCTAVCAAALGRLLTGTAMIGCMLKEQNASVTVTVAGNGPIGKLVAVGESDTVRGSLGDPCVQLPLRADGKLAVGQAVGGEGRLSVVKDMGLKNPYIGQVQLVSGEIAEDFALYFAQSEQTPSLVSLGVLTAGMGAESAGGLLLQPLPGCPDSVVEQLELRAPIFGDISHAMRDAEPEALLQSWLDGLRPVVLRTTPLRYHCGCSRARMERALISLGEKELQELIADQPEGAELTCQFCQRVERFNTQDLIRLLNKAVGAKR